MASLGWVTPGAATEGVISCPLFYPEKKLATFFSHHRLCQICGVTPVYFLLKNWRLFLLITVTFYWFHSGVTPWRVSIRTFLSVRPRFSTILCKFTHNFFPSVRPPPAPPVTPLLCFSLAGVVISIFPGESRQCKICSRTKARIDSPEYLPAERKMWQSTDTLKFLTSNEAAKCEHILCTGTP